MMKIIVDKYEYAKMIRSCGSMRRTGMARKSFGRNQGANK